MSLQHYNSSSVHKERNSRRFSLRRIMGKLLQAVSRHASMLPSSLRVRLQVWRGVKIKDPQTLFLGEDVYFDSLYPELISVGRFVRITSGARILSHFLDTSFVPESGRPFKMDIGSVIIGDNVFIGFNVVIAKPVTIHDWAIIGANSVVTKDVPRGAIVVGSPARVVGYRNNLPEELS